MGNTWQKEVNLLIFLLSTNPGSEHRMAVFHLHNPRVRKRETHLCLLPASTAIRRRADGLVKRFLYQGRLSCWSGIAQRT